MVATYILATTPLAHILLAIVNNNAQDMFPPGALGASEKDTAHVVVDCCVYPCRDSRSSFNPVPAQADLHRICVCPGYDHRRREATFIHTEHDACFLILPPSAFCHRRRCAYVFCLAAFQPRGLGSKPSPQRHKNCYFPLRAKESNNDVHEKMVVKITADYWGVMR